MTDARPVRCCPVILGTMRWHEIDRSPSDWADFLLAAHDMGVTTLHSSSEYASYDLLCETLALVRARAPSVTFDHMVKLAAPHFDEPDFAAQQLDGRVDAYRTTLGTDRLAIVQWMWRHGLDDDTARIAAFETAASAVAETIGALKSNGRIGRALCFPYSLPFARRAIAMDWVDGLAVYRNAVEQEYDSVIGAAATLDKSTVVIRPFKAGETFADGRDAASLLADALDHDGVEAAVLSTGWLDHLRELVDA